MRAKFRVLACLMGVLPALSAQAQDLAWLAGYWLSCTPRERVAETWSTPRGGLLLATSVTENARGVAFEFLRIAQRGEVVEYLASPGGRPAVPFARVESGPMRAVFENPRNDFPTRITYERSGDQLLARIEGPAGGTSKAIEWRFRLAPLNSSCD